MVQKGIARVANGSLGCLDIVIAIICFALTRTKQGMFLGLCSFCQFVALVYFMIRDQLTSKDYHLTLLAGLITAVGCFLATIFGLSVNFAGTPTIRQPVPQILFLASAVGHAIFLYSHQVDSLDLSETIQPRRYTTGDYIMFILTSLLLGVTLGRANAASPCVYTSESVMGLLTVYLMFFSILDPRQTRRRAVGIVNTFWGALETLVMLGSIAMYAAAPLMTVGGPTDPAYQWRMTHGYGMVLHFFTVLYIGLNAANLAISHRERLFSLAPRGNPAAASSLPNKMQAFHSQDTEPDMEM